MTRITILVADDNRVVRREIREILEREDDFEVVGEATNGNEATSMAKKLRPALVLMDIAMPLGGGLESTGAILKALPRTKILMLSAHPDDAYVEAAGEAGARGYLLKTLSLGSLAHAIREVRKGNKFFSPSIPKRLQKKYTS